MDIAKKTLKIFSYLYIALAIIFIGFGIYGLIDFSAISSHFNVLDLSGLNNTDPKTLFLISCVVIALLYGIYAYLLQRAVKNGKNTTLLLVLLVLGIIGSISSIVKEFSIMSLIGILLNLFVTWQVIVLRKSAE